MSDKDKATSRGLLFKNYDYGEDDPNGPGTGFYSGLSEYKSVTDFRTKKRKRRKKLLDKYFNGAKISDLEDKSK